MTRRVSSKSVLEAIRGSGGIMTTIAARLGVEWHTARSKIDAEPELLKAYNDECERVLDGGEGVVIKNIQLASEIQKRGIMADTSDAKWLLSRKGKRRGYGENLDVTTGGEKITPETMTPSEIAARAAALLKVKDKDADNG